MEEKLKFNIKNFEKTDETKPTTTRLQSIKVPRDLSLGGTKPAKKVFTPNLNVTRNKDKTKEFLKKDPIKRAKIFEKRRTANENGNRYVQSSGVFSEGATSDIRRLGAKGEKRVNIKDEPSSSMSLPTIKKNIWTINKKMEENVLEEIMNYDDEESEDEDKLAFRPNTWNEKSLKTAEREGTAKIKVLQPKLKNLKLEHPLNLPHEYLHEESVNPLDPYLSLWNLPDSFAGKGFSDNPDDTGPIDYTLDAMREGKIGKMLIRKSGVVEIHIENIKHYMETTDLSNIDESLVVFGAVDSHGDIGSAVLGSVNDRFTINPDWEELIS